MTAGRRTRSLRFRVTALAALALLAVLAAAGVGLTLAQRAVLTDGLDQNLGDRADAIAARLRAGDRVQGLDLPTDDVLVQVLAADGTVLAASPGVGSGARPPAPRRTTVTTGTFPGGGHARVLARRVDGVSVYVVGSLEDVAHSTRVLVRSLLVGVPAAAAVLAVLVWALVGRVLRPVEDIRADVDRITAGRLEHRVPEPDTGDEVARLARTMNAMLDRLADATVQQRRFVADAAHELRSPLARIRAQLEVDRAHPSSVDPEATQAALLAETGRLERLVDDLLLLARADAGAPAARAEPVDLDDVIEQQAVLRRCPGGPRIDTRGVVPVQVRGSRAELDRALGNLLDNAVRYARHRVGVTVGEVGGSAVVVLADDGPGIPAGAEEAVFERFTRLDDARGAGGGAGLGLAIARDVAVRHGGTLTADRAHRPGARFVLTLPADGVSSPKLRGMTCTTDPEHEEVRMASVQQSVDVDVPIKAAYDQWTQFESFPQFMGGVERITQLDDTHNHWVTNIDGVKREFDTEITEQHPEERIAWASTGGEAKHAGVVTFHRLDANKTRVMIQIDWEPEGLIEKAGAALGFDDRQVKADAEKFKQFIESRGAQTGAWRGDVGRPS